MTDSTTPDDAVSRRQRGFLGFVERVGNLLPEPTMIFVYLIGALMVLSAVGDALGWRASLPFSGEEAPDGATLADGVLRYDAASAAPWQIQFQRDIPARAERSYWSPILPGVEGYVSRFGLLDGLERIAEREPTIGGVRRQSGSGPADGVSAGRVDQHEPGLAARGRGRRVELKLP